MNTREANGHQDDPRLTAYALGELEGAERAEVEALIERDPAARAFVDGVRAVALELEASLQCELSADTQAHLLPDQRSEVEDAAQRGATAPTAGGPAPARKPRRPLSVPEWVGVALAAGLVGVLGTAAWINTNASRLGTESEVAVSAALDESPRSAPRTTARARQAPTSGAAPAESRGLYALSANSIQVSAAVTPGQHQADSGQLLRQLGYGTEVDSSDEDGEQDGAVAFEREGYDRIFENPFFLASTDPLSTFSIDVDTASYTNARRFLANGSLPPPDAVRVEEFVNYFPYDYAPPTGDVPFSVAVEVGGAPWNDAHRLVRIGLKGRAVDASDRAPANLVFLLDVSGSMNNPNKLPLLKRSMQMLVQHLDARDRVAIVVYAGASGLVLPSTSCEYPLEILQALEQLGAGGSTNGGAGIELAYAVAADSFIEDGINRVILATDGDFNVGTTSDGALERLIEEKAKTGVFLSVLGFGMGNYQDAKLEKLSGRGNGHFAYIDSLLEAKKVLVEELGATLETIAKDVKIQVDFNPVEVKGYRLIGYENRVLENQDFLDDTKDAGEIGAGHTVTALYEIVPAGGNLEVPGVDPSKYVGEPQVTPDALGGELLTVRLRFKRPNADVSEPLEVAARDEGLNFFELSDDTRFGAAAAAFAMVLRRSQHVGETGLEDVRRWAVESVGDDVGGYREQLVELVERAMELR